MTRPREGEGVSVRFKFAIWLFWLSCVNRELECVSPIGKTLVVYVVVALADACCVVVFVWHMAEPFVVNGDGGGVGAVNDEFLFKSLWTGEAI